MLAAKSLKNFQAELSFWSELRRVRPGEVDIGLGMGGALLSAGRVNEALELAGQLAASHQEYAQVRLLLAVAQQMSGLRQEAEKSYRAAIALDARLTEAYQGLAALAKDRGDTTTAIAIWTRLASLFPDSASLRFDLVNAYLAAGKPERAYLAIDQLPEKDRDGAAAWHARGVVLMRLQCPEAAISAYENALAKEFKEADMAWAGIGYAMASLQRFPEAIAAFTAAGKANPANDIWPFQLAVNLKDGGRATEALPIIATLLTKKPDSADYRRQQGLIFAVLDRPAEAIPALERSLQLNPQQTNVWAVLINTYQVAGRRNEAKEALQKLRAIDTEAADLAYRERILPFEDTAR